MNYMKEVAKILGVELNKDFYCNDGYGFKYRITDNTLTLNGVPAANSLMLLLDGTLTIKRTPWQPKENDVFWYIDAYGNPVLDKWFANSYQRNFYKLGNCYQTESEAKVDSHKWFSFYNSDEVLKV